MKRYIGETPLFSSLKSLNSNKTVRFHMPGHKGKAIFEDFSDIYAIDYTETFETGNLYEQEGQVRQAEILVAKFYGVHDCHFLTGGSTQGIQSMLGAICKDGGSVILDRSCHKSAMSASMLFDLKPTFIYADNIEPFGCVGKITENQLKEAITQNPQASAVLVVSPSYHGVVQDIKMLSDICHEHGKKLLVDAAHGAHFPAVNLDCPVKLGADACVLSAHKTLPAMGQGAYLLMADSIDSQTMRRVEVTVGTSSPSYPIMASLDLSRAWLEGEGDLAFKQTMEYVEEIREIISTNTPFTVLNEKYCENLDPCRLTICSATGGISGDNLADMLYDDYNISCEMSDIRCVVFIATGADSKQDFDTLKNALLDIAKVLCKEEITVEALPKMPVTTSECSVRQAFFAESETCKLEDAVDKICCRAIIPYPPGIPVLWPGEKITATLIEFLIHKCYNNENRPFVTIIKENV